MKKTRSIKYFLLATACLLSLLASPLFAQRQIRIGVVLDGPWERNEEICGTFEREITALLGGEFGVGFPSDKQLQGDFTASGIKDAVDRLLSDPDVDLVIASGPQVSTEVCRRRDLSKPVIAPFVIDPELQGIPYRQGASGMYNLSYVVIGTKALREIEVFLEIYPFDHLAVLSTQAVHQQIPELRTNLERQIRGLGIQVTFVPVGSSAEEALKRIPADAEAVYLAPLLQLGRGEFDQLIAGLIEKRLPSFSMFGRSEVERGVLAALALDLDYQRVARRVALNVQRILLGEEASTLPVAFSRRERLTINMATARAIGVYPSWYLITEAELLEEQRVGLVRQLSLPSVVREALSANLDLVSAEKVVSSGLERVRRARANRYPQLGISGSSIVIDGDRAEASFGSAARLTLAGSLGVSQLLYSEPVWANVDIEGHLQISREEQLGQLRLDVVSEAAANYLNVLRAKTAEHILRANLEVTRSNLELARSRVALGASSPGEVYRWETQIANNRRDVIDSAARRNQSEINLNRTLNRPLEEPFETKEAALDDPELVTSFQRLSPYVDNMQAFRIFRHFMVGEAINASPELRQLDGALAAQKRSLLAARRAFYVPEVRAQADVTGFNRAGAGSSSNFSNLIPDFSFPSPGNVDWTIAASASLPLFDGGGRRAAVRQADEDLAKLRIDRQLLVQRIEQRVRNELHASGSSFAGIRLANDAAVAARNNLRLVTDAYSQGTADILTLLDAQNAALVAELEAANAVYNYLVDFIDVQRAVGRFDFFLDQADLQAFMKRLDSYFQGEGYRVRKP